MSTVLILLILPATALFAIIFYNPSCVHTLVRVWVRHHRDKLALAALREMKYNDIRSSR